MKQLLLYEIKDIESGILKSFAEYCQKNGLKYYISNGTLLGAVKYGGFIPWDDDIDVLMPREDYDRFIGIFKDHENLRLLARERDSRFAYPFAKLCDTTTICIENNLDNGLEMGLNIDVFPLDTWAPSLDEAKLQAMRNKRAMNNLGYAKTIRYVPASRHGAMSKFIRRLAHPFFRATGVRYYCRKIKAESLRYRNAAEKFVGCVIWPVYGEKEILPSDVFAGTTEFCFEGEMYPAPIGYDEYLRNLYGDYRKDPPPEKCRTHHKFVAYRKN